MSFVLSVGFLTVNKSHHYTAKKSLRQAIELDLQGLDAGGEDFTYELSVPMVIATGKREGEGNDKGGSKTSPQHNDVSKWLVVTPMKTDIQYVGESLCYMLAWEPEKPMPATMVELIVSRNSGGRYVLLDKLSISDAQLF